MGSETELRELVDLLKSENPRIIQPACEYFSGLSGTIDGLNFIISQEDIFKQLMKFCAFEFTDVSLHALKTITNCAQNENGTYFYIACDKDHFCTKALFDSIEKGDEKLTKASIQLIENITRIDSGARHVFKLIKQRSLLDSLLKLFVSNKAIFYDLSLLFGNICQVPEVRKVFLQNDGEIYMKVLPFLSHDDACCRLGAANCVKNCCFETDSHEWMLKDDSIVAAILMPLAGPEELTDEENDSLPIDVQYLPSDKKRESVNDIIIALVQALHKLCSTQLGRDALRKYNVYVILRELDNATIEKEGNDVVTFEIHNVIQILIGDDAAECDDLNKLDVPEHVQKKLNESESVGRARSLRPTRSV